MGLELIPLKPGQYPVTRLPKLTTELPFFYFTKRPELLAKPIEFNTTDADGRFLSWKVIPNNSPEIGAPGIRAHQVWVRLIKPAIDASRQSNGAISSIVPLGNVRSSLNCLGWKIGGWEARSLFQSISQIGAAWCKADFWLPTAKCNDAGTPQYKKIKGDFSRLSLFAIGQRHISEEELAEGNHSFDFDLDDTIYIQLNSIEIEIQRNEEQRLVDNEYLFSVNPSERRWYELMAAKFYGVTNNPNRSSGFCEIRYSWYIERHHTLKREMEKKRVVYQMNRIIGDHLQSGYILRADYRVYREAGKPDDYIIRYYPGHFAKETSERILSRMRRGERKQRKMIQLSLPIDIDADESPTISQPTESSRQDDPVLNKLVELGIDQAKAETLSTEHREAAERELESLSERDLRGVKNIAAWLICAIERGNYTQPPKIAKKRDTREQRKSQDAAKVRERELQRHENRFERDYSVYLEQRVGEIKKSHPEAYMAFKEAIREEQEKTERVFSETPVLVKKILDAELVKYFRHHKECPVLDFWQWDAQLNANPFKKQAE